MVVSRGDIWVAIHCQELFSSIVDGKLFGRHREDQVELFIFPGNVEGPTSHLLIIYGHGKAAGAGNVMLFTWDGSDSFFAVRALDHENTRVV